MAGHKEAPADPRARRQKWWPARHGSLALIICPLAALGLLGLLGARQLGQEASLGRANTCRPASLVGLPKPEAFLLNRSQFLEAQPRLGPLDGASFLGQLLTVGRHNLATLAGRQTYYRRQWVARRELGRAPAAGQPISGGAGLGLAGPGPGPELRKKGLLERLLQPLGRRREQLEVPNLELKGQADPDRITHIDADLRGCLSPVRDQKSCGACYAFGWLALLEWHYCRQTGGPPVDFSEQHIVDCGARAWLNGCKEGKLHQVSDFTRTFGLHLERDYPYKAREGACSSAQGSLRVQVSNFRRIRLERAQFERTLREQPILLEMSMPLDIESYSSGIHPGTNCDPRIGHAMLLVGHGRQEGRPYWLLRNSMGPNWGEGGHLRLARDLADMGRCIRGAFVAKFKFRSEAVSEEMHEHFYHSIQFEPADEGPVERRPPLEPSLRLLDAI